MMNLGNRLSRRVRRLALPLALVVGAGVVAPSSALAQNGKSPTEGFFDVPKRDAPPAWGLPEYLLTTAMGGLAVFILCKSARRT